MPSSFDRGGTMEDLLNAFPDRSIVGDSMALPKNYKK
jgi:hypothetical protein